MNRLMLPVEPLMFWRVEYTACSGMSITQGCIEYVWARSKEEASQKVRDADPGRVTRQIYDATRA